MIVTVDPLGRSAPPSGRCCSTWPSSAWSVVPRCLVCTLKPAAWSVARADADESPVTSGTSTIWRPLDTVNVTVEPSGTFDPPTGFCRSTSPFGLSDSSSTTDTASPRASSAFCADDCVRLTTEGTSTCLGPDDTTTWIRSPYGAFVPPGGDVRITRPLSTDVDDCSLASTLKPTLASVLVARDSEKPSTVGT